ncbi:zf-HC2 domain-containing protein, partial [Streptomyces sp. NPDC059679]|uniref:zf-HC2 domain-containing protein n=1 Tax=Streptomyces sp. NPDC059679 TaxID=3346903 RepID=UPI00368978BE
MTLRRLIKRGGPAPAWHVTPAHAASYADGSLPETDAWSVEKHIESCAACAERVSTAVRAGTAAPALADIRAAVLAFAEAGVRARAAADAADAAGAGASPAAAGAARDVAGAARDVAGAGASPSTPASPRPTAVGGTAAGAGRTAGAGTPDLVAARDTAPCAPPTAADAVGA